MERPIRVRSYCVANCKNRFNNYTTRCAVQEILRIHSTVTPTYFNQSTGVNSHSYRNPDRGRLFKLPDVTHTHSYTQGIPLHLSALSVVRGLAPHFITLIYFLKKQQGTNSM